MRRITRCREEKCLAIYHRPCRTGNDIITVGHSRAGRVPIEVAQRYSVQRFGGRVPGYNEFVCRIVRREVGDPFLFEPRSEHKVLPYKGNYLLHKYQIIIVKRQRTAADRLRSRHNGGIGIDLVQ